MRFYGADVLSKVKSILEDDYNTMLERVRTERMYYTSMEQVINFKLGVTDRQYPECMIMMDDSELMSEELTMDISDTPEEYPVNVLILLKDIDEDLFLRQEYYIEALQRVLHGYSDTDITWILVVNSIRSEAFTEAKEILKVVGVKIMVRIL